MKRNEKKDAAFNHLLSNILDMDGSVHTHELTKELGDEKGQWLIAMQRRFAGNGTSGFQPGQIVQWKSGMKNRIKPAYAEPVIVMEVLDPPVFDLCKDFSGSNFFAEPLTLVLGLHGSEGEFFLYHCDGRRFEPAPNAGDSNES